MGDFSNVALEKRAELASDTGVPYLWNKQQSRYGNPSNIIVSLSNPTWLNNLFDFFLQS